MCANWWPTTITHFGSGATVHAHGVAEKDIYPFVVPLSFCLVLFIQPHTIFSSVVTINSKPFAVMYQINCLFILHVHFNMYYLRASRIVQIIHPTVEFSRFVLYLLWTRAKLPNREIKNKAKSEKRRHRRVDYWNEMPAAVKWWLREDGRRWNDDVAKVREQIGRMSWMGESEFIYYELVCSLAPSFAERFRIIKFADEGNIAKRVANKRNLAVMEHKSIRH